MEIYGARVVIVDDRDRAGGYLESRLKKIDTILQSDQNAIWLNQYANMANKNAHVEQTAREIAGDFNKVDWVFVGTGTTGTLVGVSEGLRRKFPRIKIVAVEPAEVCHFRRRAREKKHPWHWHKHETKACGSGQAG